MNTRYLLAVPLVLGALGWILSPYSIVVIRIENATGGAWEGAVSVDGESHRVLVPPGASQREFFLSAGKDRYSYVFTGDSVEPCAYHGKPSSSVAVRLDGDSSTPRIRCTHGVWLLGPL